MKLMELLVIGYAPLVARFHLVDGPAAVAPCGPADVPRMPRAKRASLRDLRPQITRRALGPRWRTA